MIKYLLFTLTLIGSPALASTYESVRADNGLYCQELAEAATNGAALREEGMDWDAFVVFTRPMALLKRVVAATSYVSEDTPDLARSRILGYCVSTILSNQKKEYTCNSRPVLAIRMMLSDRSAIWPLARMYVVEHGSLRDMETDLDIIQSVIENNPGAPTQVLTSLVVDEVATRCYSSISKVD